ncbi:MAG: hypothetical protein M1818_007869 [Claussenomyces sp. TS43310]|nr:MAG: hypothetical protein M1818_007869 [Claussenomyces sp. TS43310]
MLSRLLTSARKILPFKSPDTQSVAESSATPSTSIVMVTTRGQSGSRGLPGSDGPDLPPREEIPRELRSPGPSRKRRRPEEPAQPGSEDAPAPSSSSKRPKQLAVRTKDQDDDEQHTHLYVELPVESLDKAKQESTATEEVVNDLNNPTTGRSVRPPTTTTSKPGSTEEETGAVRGPVVEISKSPGSRKSHNTATKRPGFDVPSDTAIKTQRKKFGSQEPIEISSGEEQSGQVDDSEEESSDDDAPEVVNTNDAQEKARTAVRDASKAAEHQEAKFRQKRKERDAQLKDQAKSASKRQIFRDDAQDGQARAKSSNVSIVEKSENEVSEVYDDNMDDDERREDPEDSHLPDHAKSTKTKLDRANLPAFLPAEYLSDTEDPTSAKEASVATVQIPKNKKIKFRDLLEDKKPKDITRGSTTYSLAQNTSTGLLAPKADRKSRVTKEAWLQGRSGRSGSSTGRGVRKKIGGGSGGFFVNNPEKKKNRRG